MVTTRRRLVGLLAGSVAAGRGALAAAAEGGGDAVRSVLGKEGFPWYDPAQDQARPMRFRSPPDWSWWGSSPHGAVRPGLAWGWTDYAVFFSFLVAMIGLAALIARYWRLFRPAADGFVAEARTVSHARSGESLPENLREVGATDDPWAEANRRRRAGDLAGAIVYLFVHQLLTLARLDLVRLAPGRTGRQLHRSVADPEFRSLMAPTLRQFEAVYYGHRDPTAADFAAVWDAAEAFERRAATRGAG